MGYNPSMKILLATLHSRYSHASLALPSLAASCAAIDGVSCVIREYTVNERTENLLPRIVAEEADVVALSCYIWNIEATLKLVADLKLVSPGTFVVLGGPEVSYASHELMAGAPCIDCIVRGEGEETFRELICLLSRCGGTAVADEEMEKIDGISFRSGGEIVTTPERMPAKLDSLHSPFAMALVDIAKPLVYVESSRGCPFSCAFCISSVEQGVRSYSMERIKADLGLLMDAGAGTIKLVDRTFNYDRQRANRIWEFILERNKSSLFHFEIAADLLGEENFALLRRVPPGLFRFEIGVQSAHAETLERVGRSSDLERLFANVRRLKEETGVVLHLDLVAGLPGEDLAGFGESLGRLLAASPHHIQVEPLKMLKGTRMRRIGRESGYAWSPSPPYRILSTPWLSFNDICSIEAASRGLELLYNSGRFMATMEAVSRATPLGGLFTAAGISTLASGEGNRMLPLTRSLLQILEGILPPEELPPAIDALRFDYCMAGHPGDGLPDFLAEGGEPAAGPPLPFAELAARLSLPPGKRFKSFSATFGRNYSLPSAPPEVTRITFVYEGSGSGAAINLLAEPAGVL